MEIIRCPNGHFYDKEKGDTCPVCAGGGEVIDDTQAANDYRPERRTGCTI